MRKRLTPKKRCKRPVTGLAMAWPSSAEAPICCQDCGGRALCASSAGSEVGVWPVASSGHDLAELQRRIRARRQGQLVQRAGDVQRDVDAARLGLQVDIQNRLHPHRVVERDGPLADGVFRAEEEHLALGDVDAAQQRRIADRAPQPQVGLHV